MRGNPFRVGPFTGGLNLRDKFMEMSPNYLAAGQNVYAGADGVLRKRDPSIAVVTAFSGANLNFGAPTIRQVNFTASTDLFFINMDSFVYSVNVSSGVATNISGALTWTQNNNWSIVQAPTSGGQGPLYAISGSSTDQPIYWTGAGNVAAWTASVGTLFPGQQMVSFKNRIFMWGSNIGGGNAVRASKVGDPRDWDTTSTASDSAWQTSIDPNESGGIVGIWPFGAYLLVFKKSSIHIIYDLDTGANRLLTKNIGALWYRNFCDTPFGVAFHGSDGHIWITDSVKQTKLSDILSYEGSNGFTAFPTQELSGRTWPTYGDTRGVSCMAFWDDKLVVSSQGVGTWWYDFPTKAWWAMSPSNGYLSLVVKQGPPSFHPPYGGTGTTLYGTWSPSGATAAIHACYLPHFQNNAWADNTSPAGVGGQGYQSYFETPPLAPQGKGQELNLRRRYHAMRGYVSGVTTVKYVLDSLDAIPTYTTLGTTPTSTGTDSPIEYTWYSLGVGNSIRFRFDDAGAILPWAVHPFNIYTQPRTD